MTGWPTVLRSRATRPERGGADVLHAARAQSSAGAATIVRYGRRHGLVMLAVLALAAGQRPAGATCRALECRFLVPSATEVTSDLGGIPVWNAECYGRTPGQPLADHFTAERLAGTRWAVIPFRVTVVGAECGSASQTCAPFGSAGEMLLLLPEGGFRAANTYRFSIRPEPGQIPSATVVVTVAREHLGPAPASTLLRVGPQAIGPLAVAYDSLTCIPPRFGTAGLRVSQRPIEMVLPEAWERFRRSLLFAVTVDGNPWHPDCAACDSPGPGRSWVGPGREILFAGCAPPDTSRIVTHSTEGRVRPLEAGAHEVVMVAWLPGTSTVVIARAEVVLTCASEIAPPR